MVFVGIESIGEVQTINGRHSRLVMFNLADGGTHRLRIPCEALNDISLMREACAEQGIVLDADQAALNCALAELAAT